MCTCFVAWISAKHNKSFDGVYWGTAIIDILSAIGTIYLFELWIKLPTPV